MKDPHETSTGERADGRWRPEREGPALYVAVRYRRQPDGRARRLKAKAVDGKFRVWPQRNLAELWCEAANDAMEEQRHAQA